MAYLRNGLVTLNDSGGNYFLSSCIHALSSCEIFSKFILSQSDKYLDENNIAKDKESITSCFIDLINQMWVGTNSVVNSSKFSKLFLDNVLKNLKVNNIDSLDCLIILLDKFHEELNEYKNKSREKNNFYNQQEDESDKIAANRWLKTFKSMNKSIIIDLFYGQIKQILLCPYCNYENISYPFITHLNLPIPDKEEIIKTKFKVFPFSNNSFNFVDIYYYDVNKFTSILDVKNKIRQYKIFSKSKLEALLYENNELTGILADNTLIYDYIFPRYNFTDDIFIDYEISFVEKPEEKEKDHNNRNIDLYVIPIIFEEEKKYYFFKKKNILAINYCKLFCLNSESTVNDLKKEIFKYYRRTIDNKYIANNEDEVDDSYYIEFYQKLNDKKYINNEYEQYKIENNGFLEIYFYHNLPKNNGWIFSGPRCEFCEYTSTQTSFCKFDFTDNIKLKEIKKKYIIERPIILMVNFKQYEHMFKLFYEPLKDNNDPRIYLKEEVTIYDCFDIYSKRKKLNSEKEYICPQCNKDVIPYQIKEPYLSPKYLIISFNRIQKRFDDLMDLINNKKDKTPIGYPIDDLDLNPYFNNGSNNNIYALNSVILHIGEIKNAHYKTFIRKKDIWYGIDEKDIRQININEIINPDAYILIYEKKDNCIDLESNEKENESNIDANIDINSNNINNNELGEDYNNNCGNFFDENNPLKRGNKGE